MKNEAVRDALGVIVSIDSASVDGYEIVSSRKVDKDVYELVLARPNGKRRGQGAKAEADDANHTNGSTASSNGVEPAAPRVSRTWVVKSPQPVTPARSGPQGRVTTARPRVVPPPTLDEPPATTAPPPLSVVPTPNEVIEDAGPQNVTAPSVHADDLALSEPVAGVAPSPEALATADAVPSLVSDESSTPINNTDAVEVLSADSAATASDIVALQDAAPSIPAGSPAATADFFTEPSEGARPATPTVSGAHTIETPPPPNAPTAERPLTGGPEQPTATPERTGPPVSLSDDVTPETPNVAPGPVSRLSVDPAVRVAPREPSASTAPAHLTPAPEPPAKETSATKRRPFTRAPKDAAIPAKPSSRPSRTPVPGKGGAAESTRRRPFQRSKPKSASAPKAPAAPAPIRPPTAVRPRVEIDPRTGRPVQPNTPAPESRPMSATVVALPSSSHTETPSSTGSTSVEARPVTEFLKHLVDIRLVTDEQLDEAWEAHRSSGRHLFEELAKLGFASEDAIAAAVADYYHLPVLDLPREELDPGAMDLVPERIAREHATFPVSVTPEGLFVAVAEPSERLAGLLAQASGQTITMAVATASAIRAAIATNYHALTGVAELVEEFEAGESRERRQQQVSATDLADEGAPIVQVVNRILSQAMRDGASDVHIEPADDVVRVRNRVDGVLKVVLVLPAAMGLGLVSRIKIMSDMNIVERRRPQDGKFTAVIDGKEIDVRVATVATIWGETCVLRILDKTRSVLSIDDLGMTPTTHSTYSKLIRSPFGMVLCVGPTGSGKTTTLYATLTEISDVTRNVMTIEDPVEYVFPSINQIQTNEQAGLTFATGLKSILRQDSDIVLVGEIRDVETARIAVQSTLTGHFVLSSLHATDAISALTRFIDMGIESFLIASSVIAIVGQRLVRRMCPECKVPYTPTQEELAFYRNSGGPEKEIFYHGAGCNFCGHTGFKSRIGVYELCPMTPEMKRLIVGFATEDELRDLARKQGMRSIQDEAVALVAADMTTSAEVVRSIYSI